MAKKQEKVTPEILRRIFARAAKRLVELAEEGSDELLEMIHKKAAQAQDEKKESLVVSFGHTIKVDFGKNTQEDTLGGTMRLKLSLKGDLDDPDQPELFGDDDGPTLA
jgi:hypothetical protein